MEDSPAPVVLDTSVVSIIFNQDSRAPFYESELKDVRSVVSFQTLEEVLFGAYRAAWGRRRWDELKRHLAQYEVIWPGEGLVDICAQLRNERRSVGKELNLADAWIAATARMLGCPLASDDRDFDDIQGLHVIRRPSS